MALVVTLVSHPKNPVLTALLATRVAAAVGAGPVSWLSEAVACDLSPDPSLPKSDVERAGREAIADHPVDIIVQDAAQRRKKILIADMDSTMIEQECIDELAAEVGLKDHVAAITARAMNGEIAFEPALRERVALLRGLDAGIIRHVIDTRIRLASGGRTLVATMRANGAYTALISGGFRDFTDPIAAELGFHENRANQLDVENGRFSGTVAEPILGREAKAEALRAIAAERGLQLSDALAVGDGANDLDMIRLAGSGVALHAKPVVAEQAPVRIDHADLTALLFLQGYKASDFVH
ncbi:phosphoserine phosphatase SerB [Tianweitania sediminis]|uniref:Phosphoserine phosphatase n=1 Tax=Tianweitania sediminis TaxID=1502156 RepID=A0A8J7UIQ2_9HYPH|nr:phosphoserine phosphatase SerB [Tianweitania sediminis]MBP0439158.1 phosphoserine phosphatase SerB [Tianweitania sediminis]